MIRAIIKTTIMGITYKIKTRNVVEAQSLLGFLQLELVVFLTNCVFGQHP